MSHWDYLLVEQNQFVILLCAVGTTLCQALMEHPILIISDIQG